VNMAAVQMDPFRESEAHEPLTTEQACCQSHRTDLKQTKGRV
jgi:hypothetical protein